MKKETLILLLALAGVISCSPVGKLRASSKPKEPEKNEISLQDSLINYGKRFLRTPYRYGGTGTRGFDCSGYTSYVFEEFNFNLPRSSREQASTYPTISRKELKKGDLVFFEGRRRNGVVGHVGIVTENLGDGQFNFIHASVNNGVIISNSQEAYYSARYLKGGRVIEQNKSFTVEPTTVQPENNKTQVREKLVPGGTASEKQYMSEPVYHTVVRGETLSLLSKKYQVPVTTIQMLNKLNTKRIRTGQRLLIRAAVEKPEVTITHKTEIGEDLHTHTPNINLVQEEQHETLQQSEEITNQVHSYHRVQAGESLYSISKKYNTTVNEIKRLNGLSNNNIRAGQQLRVQ